MQKKTSFFQRFYVAICLVFFYLPILVTMIFSFNSSKSLTRFTGFSMRWYTELLHNTEVSKAVYVSVTIAILATVISTVLGTITANWSFQVQEGVKGNTFKYQQPAHFEPGYCYRNRTDASVFITGLPERVLYHAAGAHFFLYAICDHQCLSQGAKP